MTITVVIKLREGCLAVLSHFRFADSGNIEHQSQRLCLEKHTDANVQNLLYNVRTPFGTFEVAANGTRPSSLQSTLLVSQGEERDLNTVLEDGCSAKLVSS